MNNQHCIIDQNYIHFKEGWLYKTDKHIPIERIQDISIEEGMIHRMFHVKSLNIQTAANGGTGIPEASLIAPNDPYHVLNLILKRRDKLVLKQRDNTLNNQVISMIEPLRSEKCKDLNNHDILSQIIMIKDSVVRIEENMRHNRSNNPN